MDLKASVGDTLTIPHPDGEVQIEVKEGGTWDVTLGITGPTHVEIELNKPQFVPTVSPSDEVERMLQQLEEEADASATEQESGRTGAD